MTDTESDRQDEKKFTYEQALSFAGAAIMPFVNSGLIEGEQKHYFLFGFTTYLLGVETSDAINQLQNANFPNWHSFIMGREQGKIYIEKASVRRETLDRLIGFRPNQTTETMPFRDG